MVRKLPIAIFLAVFSFYLVTTSREPAWGDAHGMWEVADHLVADQTIAIETRWPEDIPRGRGGHYYGIAPIGPSLVHVPGAFLGGWLHETAPEYDVLVLPLVTHLAPSALGALAAVLFFLLLLDLGIGARTASLATAILAFATTTWVYAHYPYSEILQLACFLGLFRAVLRVCNAPVRREALWLGFWAGCLLNSKYVFAAAIVGGLIVIAWTLRKRRAELLTVIKWGAVTGVPFVVLALAYNYLRWGSITRTGYEPYLDIYFGGSLLDGAWGMLLSPNKSVFLYSPPLIVAAIGFPMAIRAVPRLGLAMLAMVVPVFLIYCTYRSWSGDYAWGSRFFVWATPVVLVPIAWVLDRLAGRVKAAIVVAIFVAGIGVQVLGTSLYWDHFIRIAIDVKNQWLGKPNRAGSYIAEKGRGHCDSCFEDTYEILWTPAFQPIRGHAWLLRSIARGDTPKEAQVDAPWRAYTTLPVHLEGTYPRARIDWWGFLWIYDAKQTFNAGLATLLGLLASLGYGAASWLRLHRRE